MRNIKLSEWARRNSYSYRRAFDLFHLGKISGAFQTNTGKILVPENEKLETRKEYIVIYSRVSSSENKSNLESQAKRLLDFCSAKGWVVSENIKECASGLNDQRPKLLKVLSKREATKIVVEHKDRLTRFGFNFIETLYPECEIIVINETDSKNDDLMDDFVSVITSFCARLYGHRRSKRKTEKIISELRKNETEAEENE